MGFWLSILGTLQKEPNANEPTVLGCPEQRLAETPGALVLVCWQFAGGHFCHIDVYVLGSKLPLSPYFFGDGHQPNRGLYTHGSY